MTDKRIEVMENGIRVHDLDIPRRDVADYLRRIPEEEYELAFVQAVEVGIFCLERSRTSQDTEFVRRQFESLLNKVETDVGAIPGAVQEALVKKIGTGDGEILSPIKTLVNAASDTAKDRLKEVQDLLSQEIDPAKESSTLGRALKVLRDLLDPNRKDSVQSSFVGALDRVTAKDGTLAEAVKAVVRDTVDPLVREVEKLGREIRGQEAAAEAIQQTIEKGISYEEEVVTELQDWSKVAGAEVHHVGTDNRPGDILIKLSATSIAATGTSMVIEVRDRQSPLGRKAISDTLNEAMAERKANAAIYLSRSPDGLAKDVGEWAEGECERGPFVATTHEHLTTAIRFLIVCHRLVALRTSRPETDAVAVEAQLERIRTALGRVATINRKVTDVRGSANEIQTEAEALRDEIRSGLSAIESAIHVISKESKKSDAA